MPTSIDRLALVGRVIRGFCVPTSREDAPLFCRYSENLTSAGLMTSLTKTNPSYADRNVAGEATWISSRRHPAAVFPPSCADKNARQHAGATNNNFEVSYV